MDLKGLVRMYALEQACAKELGATLREGWKKLPRSITVWRGQQKGAVVGKGAYPFFSTSKSKDVARDEFAVHSEGAGVLYEIEVRPGVPILDVNELIGTAHDKATEKEILVDGSFQFASCVRTRQTPPEYKAVYGPPTPDEMRAELMARPQEVDPDEEAFFKEFEAQQAAKGRRRRKNGTKRSRKRKGNTRRR